MVLTSSQNWLLAFIALMGIPAGLFIAKMTKEELKDGRKWFLALGILSLLGSFLTFFLAPENVLWITTFVFIFFLSVTSLVRKLK